MCYPAGISKEMHSYNYKPFNKFPQMNAFIRFYLENACWCERHCSREGAGVSSGVTRPGDLEFKSEKPGIDGNVSAPGFRLAAAGCEYVGLSVYRCSS